MKTFLFLFIILSCGKVPPMNSPLIHHESSLPQKISFANEYHQANFKAELESSHLTFENSQEVMRFYPYELTQMMASSLYRFHSEYSQHFDLYLHHQGASSLLDPAHTQFDPDQIEQLNLKKSYLFLAVNPQFNNLTLIHHLKDNKIEITTNTLSEYLKLHQLSVQRLDINVLLEGPGDERQRWWVKSNGNHHKFIFASSNELKDQFLELYQYQKQSLKRHLGKAQKFELEGFKFVKITAVRTEQKPMYQTFKKIYYTQQGQLPYSCTFTQATAAVTSTQVLTKQEISSFIPLQKNTAPFIAAYWNEFSAPTLTLSLPALTAGYFAIGLVSRDCIKAGVYPIHTTQVNTERELELIVESYRRRE